MAGNESRTQRKLEKRKRKAEERRQRAAVEQIQHGRGIDRFTVQYPTPEMLVVAGPIAMATWCVPEALKHALEVAGRPVPPPIGGGLLIDTGATKTCIAEDVAQDLGLTPIGMGHTHGAGGLHQLPIYQALVQITITDPFTGNQSVVGNELQATAIKQLNLAGKHIEHNGVPLRLIGLLGRDFLRHAKLIYDGPAGLVEVQMNLKTMRER